MPALLLPLCCHACHFSKSGRKHAVEGFSAKRRSNRPYARGGLRQRLVHKQPAQAPELDGPDPAPLADPAHHAPRTIRIIPALHC